MPEMPPYSANPVPLSKYVGASSVIRAAVFFGIALFSVLATAWYVYQPGLKGPFLFDDFVNLNALGITGPVDSWPSLLRYLTSGNADPTGRPLALLSFLVDAQNWPADPFPFKRTNVLLHLLNGALLCWTTLKLGSRAGLRDRVNRSAALLSAGIWLLHPLFISTTLYIVQREAMLPTTFGLIGIMLWCRGRERLTELRIASAWMWMASGVVCCTLLATLCKSNGALLPLLIGMTECSVLRVHDSALPPKAAQHLRWQRIVLLVIPTLALALYLLSQLPVYIHTSVDKRPWTITERLISEPRVLMTYLRLLWLPRATSEGVFNDQTVASTSWLTPWTTLPCMLAVITLCAFGWQIRKRNPMLALAILFYFAGQAMESTFIPLELFFEHRNYLPATFMFWPLAIWLSNGQAPWARRTFATLILTITAFLTWTGTSIWGNSRQQALIWATTNPDSARAQVVAASVEMEHGNYASAISRLRTASNQKPDEAQLTLNLVDAECAAGQVTPRTWQLALFSLRHTNNSSQPMFDWFGDAIPRAKRSDCTGLTLINIHQALEAIQSNPLSKRESGIRQGIAHASGLLALTEHRPQTALEDFNRAYLENPHPGAALAQAAELGAAGYPAYGLRHLDFARLHAGDEKFGLGMPRLHHWVLEHQGYWKHETSVLRATLSADASKQSTPSTNPQT